MTPLRKGLLGLEASRVELLIAKGADLEVRDKNSWMPLRHVVSYGNIGRLKLVGSSRSRHQRRFDGKTFQNT